MLRNILFALVLILLGVSFYYSRDFQLIAAGVAVLLFGMRFLEDGFNRMASGTLYRVIKRLSNNIFLSFLLGIFSTAILQSSSLITVIAISFLSTGLLSLRSGLAIVFGANLGTTSTAWIVAFLGFKLSISALALPMIFFGIILQSRKVAFQKAFGNVLLGLGGFFMGVYLMQLGFTDLQESAFIIPTGSNHFVISVIALLSGFALTGILQSSSATMAIIITALAAGQIDFDQSLAMAIGANIGTTVTAILSSLNAQLPGKQLAVGHFIFNVATGVVALALLPVFKTIIEQSAKWLELSSGELTLRLALFHTLFNILGVLLIMPFIKPLERLLLKIRFKSSEAAKPKYLLQEIERVPQSAFLALYQETNRVLKHLCAEMKTTLNFALKSQNQGFLQMLTTQDMKPFEKYYYHHTKPILAEIQRCSANLSGTFPTNQFSIASRLIAEISRDFNHVLKDAKSQALMDQESFVKVYRQMLEEIAKALDESLLQLNNGEEKTNKLLATHKKNYNRFNKHIIGEINRLIREGQLTSLAGTTLIHNADYTKRVINKLHRTMQLVSHENYLEQEAEFQFREDLNGVIED